eukprot:CAMPEP_0178475298 /NCGR_PEP_ID=MMETSP0696-20121128/3042_1 /TAXON_ID=265572 /ORGANISM="Extubocellulus spinifer, Strain CCMP396" /LENGTH=105 /DNA_ID=CAMNT_0020102571 /DNA_START=102 /DNA_END=420 /DNA_ORIENTATION=+
MVLSRTYPRLASAASSPPSSSIPRPNRFTAAFNEMKRACPDEMKSYADCVLLGHKAGSLERGTCQQEFDLVKKCFKEVDDRCGDVAERDEEEPTSTGRLSTMHIL